MAVAGDVAGVGVPEGLLGDFLDVVVQRVGVGLGLELRVRADQPVAGQPGRNRVVEADTGVPFRREHQLLAVGIDAGAAGVLEVVVLAFQVADIGGQLQVVGQCRQRFQLDAIGVRLANVGPQADTECRVIGIGLQVFVVVVEQRQVGTQATVEEVTLEAGFPGGHVFRREGLFGRRLGWRAVVVATGLEALGDVGVLIQVRGPGVFEADFRAGGLPGLA
ncbi:hypothetical protein D3C85_1018530 [compost metagenome]